MAKNGLAKEDLRWELVGAFQSVLWMDVRVGAPGGHRGLDATLLDNIFAL